MYLWEQLPFYLCVVSHFLRFPTFKTLQIYLHSCKNVFVGKITLLSTFYRKLAIFSPIGIKLVFFSKRTNCFTFQDTLFLYVFKKLWSFIGILRSIRLNLVIKMLIFLRLWISCNRAIGKWTLEKRTRREDDFTSIFRNGLKLTSRGISKFFGNLKTNLSFPFCFFDCFFSGSSTENVRDTFLAYCWNISEYSDIKDFCGIISFANTRKFSKKRFWENCDPPSHIPKFFRKEIPNNFEQLSFLDSV